MHQTFFKPAKGTALLAQRERRASDRQHERDEKEAVRVRDGRQCRWPRCEFKSYRVRIEVAHLEHKSMGGNPAQDRSQRHKMLCLCFLHHQGERSLHSGDLKVEPQNPALGTDGPLDFYAKDHWGKFEHVASERVVGVSVERSAR